MGFAWQDLAAWSGGTWSRKPEGTLERLSNDSRRIQESDIFAAIPTHVRDGHDYVAKAQEGGASAAIVERLVEGVSIAQLQVPNTRQALMAMARQYRLAWECPVVGITGSCGKTSTKDLLSSFFGAGTLSTEGNLNNLLGVPLTILQSQASSSRFAVIEAGISEPGEMEKLASMIQPDIAIITSIGPAHLEALGDEATVAREKSLLAKTVRTKKLYAAESFVPYAADFDGPETVIVSPDGFPDRLGSFALRFDENATELRLATADGEERYNYQGAGKGLASNAALAILVARSCGISKTSIQEALTAWRPASMRGEWLQFGERHVYLDCYNANPLSMQDALDTFNFMSEGTSRLFILGGMEELGEASYRYHEGLGQRLPMGERDEALLIGNRAEAVLKGLQERNGKGVAASVVEDMDAIKRKVAAFSGDIFIKGSRKYRLENAIENLRAEQGEGASC